MDLTRAQLEAALERAIPGTRLRAVEASGADAALRLDDGRVLILRRYPQDAAEPAALRLLASEADLPVPQLVAFVADDEPLGQPYGLLAPLVGEPLLTVLPQLSDQDRYALGRRLGQLMARVHTLVAPRFGSLQGTPEVAALSERAHLLARLEQAIGASGDRLSTATARNLTRWFDEILVETGRPPRLVHGALGPERLRVQRGESQWRLTGILGWGAAQGWSPGWDHAIFIVNAADAALFSLRVGYGEAYDEANERAYEQVRELALAPYRLLLSLERIVARPQEAPRYVRLIEAMLAALLTRPGDNERFSSALSA